MFNFRKNGKLKIIIASALFAMLMCGCSNNYDLEQQRDTLNSEIQTLQKETENLKQERDQLQKIISDTREENGIKKYIVTFEIKQTHVALDIGTHLKDSMNKLVFDVLVDQTYYNSVNVGDCIKDDFRAGSFLMKGSIGNWDVTVKDKRIE